MSNSPYISPEIKQYMNTHRLEEMIKDAVNQILAQKPADPFTSFSQYFGKLSSPVITITGLSAFEVMNSEMKPTLQLEFAVKFKDETYQYRPRLYFTLAEQEALYDDEQKNVKQALTALGKIANLITMKNTKEQKSVDESLKKYLTENPTHVNVVQQVSYSLIPMTAHFFNTTVKSILIQQLNSKDTKTPRLYINMLQGSKIVGSKCKVYKFIIIINDEGQSALNKIQAITQNVRKTIVSGKKGEAGLQYYQDGTYICPGDTVVDNMKILESAIETAQLKDQVSIGLVWLAETFYMPDDKKYDLDNPKKLTDSDQMIEYYFKLCNDKPIITYLEDPLHINDVIGWNKLLNKFKDSKVQIGSRRLYSTLDKARKHCEIVNQQINPDLSEQQITQLNNERVSIEYIYKTLYDFPTFTDFQNYIQYIYTKKPQAQIILGDTMQDSEDTSLIDMAFSISNSGLSICPPTKYEKLIKYNQYLRQCEDIKQQH